MNWYRTAQNFLKSESLSSLYSDNFQRLNAFNSEMKNHGVFLDILIPKDK